ncbi:MAG: nuclear transport factor 2 family protein [Thermoanaerobaculia bacterium]|nr:nuclear transport factor 2 family protein [Thermoanaerobaculia bacterium]
MSKRLILVVVLTLLAAGLPFAFADSDGDAAEIKALIEKAYVHGAFNELNPDALERGFHPDFAIFSADGEAIKKYPIADWVKRTRERKSADDFDPATNVWEHHFASVDVTGHSASVKIELSKDGKKVYTDYLSLLKFESGWRIVAKVYHRHQD